MSDQLLLSVSRHRRVRPRPSRPAMPREDPVKFPPLAVVLVAVALFYSLLPRDSDVERVGSKDAGGLVHSVPR